MQSILNIWLLLFWISWFFFFINTSNVIKLLITSEVIWLILYGYAVIVGVYVDDIHLFTLSLLILTLASVEFSIGFVLIIFFKKIFKTTKTDNLDTSDWTVVNKLNNRR